MVYTGWVGEKRGLNLMLEGLKLIKKKTNNIHLVIVGAQNKYINKINNFANENELKNNLSVFGRMEYTTMPSIIKSADVCLSFLEVNKSYSMSPPQKIFEYFAMGKHVIANKIPTHTDYIKDGYNGKIIDDLDPKQFSDVIIKIINNKDVYKAMCNNAFEYSSKYKMENIENRLISKIEELITNE